MTDQTKYIDYARQSIQNAKMQSDFEQRFESHVANSKDLDTNGIWVTNQFFRDELVDLDLERGLNTMPARECLNYDVKGDYTEWKLNLDKNILPFIRNGLTKPVLGQEPVPAQQQIQPEQGQD